MNKARFLWFAITGLFVAATGASADPSPTDPADNPYVQMDPDGVPLAVTQHQPQQLSQSEIDAIHDEQQRAARDRDWLLRNYEQQLQTRAAANSSADANANLYYQLSSNKDLAKLAGLPALDSDSQGAAPPSSADAAHPDRDSLPSGTGTSSATASGFLAYGNFLKPVITPLGSADAAGLHNFYSSSLPTAMPSPFSDHPALTPPAPKSDQYQEPSDLETPGLVAAEKNPAMDTGEADLTLDVLPGETIEQARADQANSSKLELPLPPGATQLHKAQAASLGVPNATTTTTAPTAAPNPATVKIIPINDDDAPLPVSKATPINPVRAPIASPYDILNR